MVETPPPKARSSWYLLIGGIFAFLASLILFISFCSPYWFESYPETYSEFVRMGLWNFCFRNYRHPSYQYDELFDGCHWVFSYKYQNIRDWMQPAWLIFVQAVMSLSVIFALLSLSCISVILMRFLLKLEVFFIGAAFVFEAIISVIMFLGVSVFGGMCYNRSWLQYPSFNHLSWAYGLAVVSMFFHMFAAAYLYADTKRAQDYRRRTSNLVYNMHPRY
ncbi:hypothetical protein CDAR_197191 [Caerostris darwini]|uniref:Uncharacterized protein n=1 Tax=Caerostris darwini TaxID=1538125 RepID=A0AAV4MBA0_9ARAC|nr:hypothetical protein CDAR_197191 [Caerostris darwini]